MTTHRRSATIASVFNLLLVTAMADTSAVASHNITAILAEDPRFTTFNHHLTATGLADVVNCLTEVTVCAMDNAAMSELFRSLNPSPTSLRRILLFHLFSHYSDADYLNSCCAWTLFPRPSGSGNEVVDLREIDGKVSFMFPYNSDYSQLLGYVKLIPRHLSVLHVSTVLPSPEAWSLKSPIHTLTIMEEVGCRDFAGAVAEAPIAKQYLRENTYVGMTVLCPVDAAWERFEPRFRAMSEEEKTDLLLFHAIPVIHQRCEFVTAVEDWSPLTLASHYRGNGGFGEPAIKVLAMKKLIAGDGFNNQGPLVVYPIRGVLLPDDPVGVVEYLDPNATQYEAAIDQDCVGSEFFSWAPAPAPEPSQVVDSDLVQDDKSLQLTTY